MSKATGGRISRWTALLLALPLPLLHAPASAQESPGTFNAANAENRRYSEEQNQLRNQALQLRKDRASGLLQCQGAGSAAAQAACVNNLDLNQRRRGLDLNNQRIQQQNSHDMILKGLGVH